MIYYLNNLKEDNFEMKKIKFIALAVILMLGLIGGAYAYWTESIVLGGTVETGYMDVKFTSIGVSNWNKDHLVPWGTDASGTSWVQWDGKKASFHVKGLYPQKHPDDFNIYQNVQIYVLNDSTIPVKLDSVVFKKTAGSNALWNNMKGIVHLRIYDETNNQIYGTYSSVSPENFSNMEAAFENVWSQFAADYPTQLEPGWTARFGQDEPCPDSGSFIFWLEPGAGNVTQSKDLSFDIEFNWTQYNAQ